MTSAASGNQSAPLGEPIASPSLALGLFAPPPLTDLGNQQPAASAQLRYGFRVGGLGFLIHHGTGSECIATPSIAAIPNSARWLLGLINLRGNLVPVFDMKRIGGLEMDAGDERRMTLILDKGEKAVGIVIDDYPVALKQLSKLHSLPELPTALHGHIAVGYNQDDETWLEFDHEGFFESLTSSAAV